MATNLVREGGGFVWTLDFDAMERLLRDFFVTDLWPVVESPAPEHDIHIVKASESSAISNAAVKRQSMRHRAIACTCTIGRVGTGYTPSRPR